MLYGNFVHQNQLILFTWLENFKILLYFSSGSYLEQFNESLYLLNISGKENTPGILSTSKLSAFCRRFEGIFPSFFPLSNAGEGTHQWRAFGKEIQASGR